MTRAKLYILTALIAVAAGTAMVMPSRAYACEKVNQIFGITTWYRGLQTGANCSVEVPASGVGVFVTTIALNIIQAGLVIVGYVTVFFLIKGGFVYITSAGSSDGMSAAKKTITNALVGLIIALMSAAIVNAIAGAIR